jgi:LPXTG-motif cell wall-anchored protein
VNVEQGNGGVCASQIDLLKEANPPAHIAGLDLGALLSAFTSGNLLNLLGPIVVIDPVGGDFINGMQLDMPQFKNCDPSSVLGTTETNNGGGGTAVSAASGELPRTGSGSWPIAIVGFAFLAVGWVLLAARSAKVAAALARSNRF